MLSNGNLIIMVSDGIIDVGGEWLPAMLRGFEDAPVQEIADTVLREALNIAKGKKEDDMSIIAARLNML